MLFTLIKNYYIIVVIPSQNQIAILLNTLTELLKRKKKKEQNYINSHSIKKEVIFIKSLPLIKKQEKYIEQSHSLPLMVLV